MRVLILLLVSLPLSATVLFDTSTLLTNTTADQLGTWLGEGDLQLTRIYAATSPTNWSTFHAAADGQGRTFTVLQALTCGLSICITTSVIIGGYDPQSWNSSGTFNITAADAGRTGFVFNLTDTVIHRQILGPLGEFQTYNDATVGPTFGGGQDLFVGNNGGTQPYGSNYSYGSSFTGTSIAGPNPTGFDRSSKFSLGQIEVFTISAADTPEPASFGLALTGLSALLLAARRRSGFFCAR